jgi:hypothetical protein
VHTSNTPRLLRCFPASAGTHRMDRRRLGSTVRRTKTDTTCMQRMERLKTSSSDTHQSNGWGFRNCEYRTHTETGTWTVTTTVYGGPTAQSVANTDATGQTSPGTTKTGISNNGPCVLSAHGLGFNTAQGGMRVYLSFWDGNWNESRYEVWRARMVVDSADGTGGARGPWCRLAGTWDLHVGLGPVGLTDQSSAVYNGLRPAIVPCLLSTMTGFATR